MKNYRSIEVKILGKDYKYKVDEPEDVIKEILENIKSEVETYAKKIGGEEVDYIFLLLLLNERLNSIRTKQEIKQMVDKFSDMLNTALKSNDEGSDEQSKSIQWG
ncbi:hypothetical protein Pmob_0152 [Petrotoga mobilis SJ95]|jgi:CRISPR/Cas system-associated protein Cas5 (RAMP superfamily)|uniref:Cell division protein ZapA n=1 Tax=Petrotoga mobilis (strain DSM 10674 / SJ95) TaxID=403833 RepID=A9BFB4_PETMO|nr:MULTISPECIES: cell division protein ZapA [Petrotoga]ABX30899.1 hypothetical protein Pmob_0152 [Petrotoga mobilis SJ95]MBL5981207.1 hypothetical protein [Petrotoga sp. 8T1HF07.NaAc.6.1]PNR88674.1 hypothetical protein X925_05520 [Petrotoga sp. 9T1HF07.CasAA.8.2]PNR92717.1 hypothetical protein X926_05760 [Petrotoga sp. HWHPT.55.6.3]RLL83336.1 hypothetical protein BZ25_07775 [Petrotoga sp. Shatin.DS.tank11.9.2.9.3]